MTKLALAATFGAASLALAACGDSGSATVDANNVAAADDTNGAVATGGNEASAAAGAAAWAKDSRIVEENGVTYRVDADGTRVALGPNESKIVVENKVRYRVDPDGRRVKIDDHGLAIDLPHVDLPNVDLPKVDLPDVDAGINRKGHPDIDVKSKADGNKGPN
jgi:hypothetical protein